MTSKREELEQLAYDWGMYRSDGFIDALLDVLSEPTESAKRALTAALTRELDGYDLDPVTVAGVAVDHLRRQGVTLIDSIKQETQDE